MQTTLLGLAIAAILALVTALVGPFLIDWGTYRGMFESEASRLIGLNVQVKGSIEARLLPSPRILLHEIAIGGDRAEKLEARSLGIEFALGPLMRGEWRASEMQLIGPEINLGLDAAGHVQAPRLALRFDPDALSIERLSIQDGKAVLSDAANGSSVTLEKFWFNGEAKSLAGPIKGEGAVTINGELFPYRVAAGRFGDDARARVRIQVDPVNLPLSIETDGALTLAGDVPKFDGVMKLARPVGIAPGAAGVPVTQPWRITAKIKASAAAALMQQVEFHYGSEEQGFTLTGAAEFKFGRNPRFEGVLSGRQIDLDRMLASGDARPPPAAVIRKLAEAAGNAFAPTIPVAVGIGLDQVTLGGNTVQALRGDITTAAGGWNLDRFEFRAPGYTQVRLSGLLAVDRQGVAFNGPAEIETGAPKLLAAWLAGKPEPEQGALRPLRLRGDVTLGSEKIAISRLKATFDRETVSGRLAYVHAARNRPSRLDAELKAPELDLDVAIGFSQALLAGSSITRPKEIAFAFDIGRATYAGIEGRNAGGRLLLDGAGLRIDKFAIEDLGGASISANGLIDTAAAQPRGNMEVDFAARDLNTITAIVRRFAPEAADAVARAAPVMSPAKLRATFSIEGAPSGGLAKLDIQGTARAMRVSVKGQANTEIKTFDASNIKLQGRFGASDGRNMVSLLGLDDLIAVDDDPAIFTFNASGALRGAMKVDGRLTGGWLEAEGSGTLHLFADAGPTASLRAKVARIDLSPLRGAVRGRAAALPVTLDAQVALSGSNVTLSDLTATIAGSKLRGKLALALAKPKQLQGEFDADTVDIAELIAAAIGMPAADANAKSAKSWSWPAEPFTGGTFAGYDGRIALRATRATFAPGLTARDFRVLLRLGGRDVSLEAMDGVVAGGRLTGKVSFRHAGDGIDTMAKFALVGADAVSLLPSLARPPVSGKLGLAADIEGAGLSPVALVGSLRGSGKLSLTDARFAGLDPRIFDTVTRAVDNGLPVDVDKIGDVVRKALGGGSLSVRRMEGDIAISAGQVRLNETKARGDGADMAVSGTLDLTEGSLDARVVLSGAEEAGGSARPDVFMALWGPVASPSRTIDVSALTGWLTLRAVEHQARRLQAIERKVSRPEEAPLAPPPAPEVKMAPPLPTPTEVQPLPGSLPAPIDIGPARDPSVGAQN